MTTKTCDKCLHYPCFKKNYQRKHNNNSCLNFVLSGKHWIDRDLNLNKCINCIYLKDNGDNYYDCLKIKNNSYMDRYGFGCNNYKSKFKVVEN